MKFSIENDITFPSEALISPRSGETMRILHHIPELQRAMRDWDLDLKQVYAILQQGLGTLKAFSAALQDRSVIVVPPVCRVHLIFSSG